MIRKNFTTSWLALSLGISSSVAQLQFTNITLNPAIGLPNNTLSSVAYDGASHFVAVGTNNQFVTVTFVANESLLTSDHWSHDAVLPIGRKGAVLTSVAFSLFTGPFVATGSSDFVSSSSDGTGGWNTSSKLFARNTARGTGIAWNNRSEERRVGK